MTQPLKTLKQLAPFVEGEIIMVRPFMDKAPIKLRVVGEKTYQPPRKRELQNLYL